MSGTRWVWVMAAAWCVPVGSLASQEPRGERIRDLVVADRAVPRRIVGYGLVVGLQGTGDRTSGNASGAIHTVQSVANLLRRFDITVPPERMRLRNVAAVLVTAEISPYLRSGGRFDVSLASLGDATSLRGGVLWIAPLVEDPGKPPVGTAQGPLIISDDPTDRSALRSGTSGRIPEGGVLEVDPGTPPPAAASRLLLRRPDLGLATRISGAINVAFGAGTAQAEDPGSVRLKASGQSADTVLSLLAAIETLTVRSPTPPRLLIDARDGTIVAGGDLTVGAAVVSHRGITLTIGGAPPDSGSAGRGLLHAAAGASVQEVAAGLYAAGARPHEIGAVFEALREVGAIHAEVVVR